jgi:ABC-2 type transport system ATP-binding protein
MRGLSFRYRGQPVLCNLNLQIDRGESLLLLGQNGAGKTTLMSCLLGLLRPQTGQITRHGKPILAGYLDEPPFFPEKTGWFQLQAEAWMRGLPLDKKAIRLMCEQYSFHPTGLDQPVYRYSTGMKKKLALIRAVIAKPDLLILDEPANGLDPEGIKELRENLCRLRTNHGMSLLVSSHQISESQKSATRAVILHRGRITDSLNLEPANGSRTWALHCEAAPNPEQRAWLERLTGMSDWRDSTRCLLPDISEARIPTLIESMVQRGFRLQAFYPVDSALEECFLRRLHEEEHVQD